MKNKITILKLMSMAAFSLSVVACGSSQSDTNTGHASNERITLKALIALDDQQQAKVLQGFNTECVLPLSFSKEDEMLGKYWRDSYSCVAICRITETDPIIIGVGTASVQKKSTIVGVNYLDQYAIEQDADGFNDVVGDCDFVEVKGPDGEPTL